MNITEEEKFAARKIAATAKPKKAILLPRGYSPDFERLKKDAEGKRKPKKRAKPAVAPNPRPATEKALKQLKTRPSTYGCTHAEKLAFAQSLGFKHVADALTVYNVKEFNRLWKKQ